MKRAFARAALVTSILGVASANAAPINGYADLHAHWFSTMVENRDFGLRYSKVYCPDRIGSHVDCALLDYPHFNNHPKAANELEQKAYYEWIKRAQSLGQRLVVVKAVYNDSSCKGVRDMSGTFGTAEGLGRRPDVCDVQEAVKIQLNETKAFVNWVRQHDGDWMEMAYSPEQARQIMERGKLAVVLGVEVDDLFGCAKSKTCTQESVTRDLQELWSMGVRQITPIHGINNAFGGAGIAFEVYSYANRKYNGEYFDLEFCSGNDTEFRLKGFRGLEDTDAALAFTALFSDYWLWGPPTPPPGVTTGHCNKQGLTELGSHLIKEMMRLGMLVDIDHMSERSFQSVNQIVNDKQVLNTLNRTRPYPMISSHTGLRMGRPQNRAPFTDRLFPRQIWFQGPAEWHKSTQQIQQIKASGGMIAPILTQFDSPGYTGTMKAPPNDCRNSSTTFAHNYLTMMDLMGGEPVGIGTDVNGMAPFLAPRRGADRCLNPQVNDESGFLHQWFTSIPKPNQTPAQGGVNYGQDQVGGYTINASRTGTRTFDIATDGVAHYGMIPDMMAELQNLGLDQKAIDAFYGSAERYLQVWSNASPPAGFNVRPAEASYAGISPDLPDGFSGGNCHSPGHEARWWTFDIELLELQGLNHAPQVRITGGQGGNVCAVTSGDPGDRVRVAVPVAPDRDPSLDNRDVAVEITIEETNSGGAMGPARVTRRVRLEVPQPRVSAIALRDQAWIEPGLCPAPTYQLEEASNPLEASMLRARFQQNGSRVMIPVMADVKSHTSDYMPTEYTWSSRYSGSGQHPDPDWFVPVCHCGEETISLQVAEDQGLQTASGLTTIQAPALNPVVNITLIDEYGNPIPDGSPATPVLAELSARMPDGSMPPGSCTWVENFWSDALDPLNEQALPPARLIQPHAGACDALVEIWTPNDAPTPWNKMLRGIVRLEDGPACGLDMWNIGRPDPEFMASVARR